MQFMARILRAAKFESRLYEEVEADQDATSQALVVVLLSSLAASIGTTTRAGLSGLLMPAAWCFGLRPARFLHQAREARLLLSPYFQFLPHGTGARDQRDEIDLALDTDPQGTATIGLTIGDDPTDSLQPQGQTLLKGYGRFHTITAVAIAQAQAQGSPPGEWPPLTR